MRRAAIVVALTLALVLAGAAHAHFGNIWFQTRASMEENIDSKYRVQSTSCRPAPNAHWSRDNEWSLKRWDHFVCGVYSEVSGRTCVVLAHQAGGQWSSIVLTGYKNAVGTTCVPRDLRRR